MCDYFALHRHFKQSQGEGNDVLIDSSRFMVFHTLHPNQILKQTNISEALKDYTVLILTIHACLNGTI